MIQTTLQKASSRAAIVLSVFCLLIACKKELSLETGGFSGTAQGELIDTLGECKNVTLHGTYKVDTALNNDNYVVINVNFTAAGKYKIFSDTANGMWFIDSGFAVSTGQTTVKIKGKGTPILNKKTDFALTFNNNLCTFAITPSGSSTGSGGSGGSGGTGTKSDYFPTTSGSSWVYQYIPKMNTVDTFTVVVAQQQVQLSGDSLLYSQFATRLQDTFYFAKTASGNYYSLSTIDFDYTFLFDSIPNGFISYPFLKENLGVGGTWESGEYGKVRLGSPATGERGYAKAVFTIMTKNTTPYTIAGKTYSDVINVKRDIMFKPDGGSYRLVISGNSYYAKGYGLIDQTIGTSPNQQAVSLYKTPDIK